MNGAGSELMGIPVICRKGKLPKLKKQLKRRKLMASFREALSKVILDLLSVHVALNFATTINCFYSPLEQKLISSLITFFSLLCGIFVQRVEKS